MKGSLHIWSTYMKYRWFKRPHWVRPAAFEYEGRKLSRHRDVMDRVVFTMDRDCYISPFDGKVKTLVVQTVDDILSDSRNATWKRTYIINVAPWRYRLAMWPYSHIDTRESKA